jgi:hypothetical protein
MVVKENDFSTYQDLNGGVLVETDAILGIQVMVLK